ncbi:MAG TPA: glycosyltransferase family 2 protein [Candidatus Binatia bacterium]|nr:glycosyltransferase family 2 protein [Candidatus Binatia bacterium]
MVVHWGAVADTLACLRSLAVSTLRPRPLLVIDNGTRALDARAVAAAAPDVVLVPLPENRGFAGGANEGLRRALAAGATFVLLLNNDATAAPDCLAELVRVARSAPDVAAVGAKVLCADAPGVLWAAWERVTWRAALVAQVGRGAADGPAFAAVRTVEAIPGCAMLLTRPALDAVGLFDEAFFAYHEDVDWCVRARARGFRILFAPTARVLHRGEGSLAGRGRANPARYLSARNTVLFARKHARARDWLRLAVTIGASLPLAALRERSGGQGGVVRLLLRGYRDGLLGRDVPVDSLGLR